MKKLLRRYLGELTWQKMGQAKQEFKWRKINNHAAPELRNYLVELLDSNEGFYVEVGSNDGRSFSNTYFLEKTRNWSGMLIEPILHKYFESKNTRDNTRNIFIYGACVDRNYGDSNVKMYFSNLMTTSDLGNTKQWAEAGSNFLHKDEEVLPFWAPAIVLEDVFENYEIQKVDFLSIDVEGAELSVLKGIDFHKCEIDVILIETPQESESIGLLISNGYTHVQNLGINHIFVRNSSLPVAS